MQTQTRPTLTIVRALGEEPLLKAGDHVRVSVRYPVGHYRVPRYIRGKHAVVESVILPPAIDNEQEGFGKNAGTKIHYYRVGILLADLWPGYSGSASDRLHIEVSETWMEKV